MVDREEKMELSDTLKCPKCKKPYVKEIDDYGWESEYVWKPNCKCSKKGYRVSVG